MIAIGDHPRCSPEEWDEFRTMVSHGMLFEVLDWIESGKPTLRPKNKKNSAFEKAVLAPNLSLTQVLWEKAWQERSEVVRALSQLSMQRTSAVVMRYVLEQGCPVDHVTGYDLCLFHDPDLVRLGMALGVSILEPDGWASAFRGVGSRPLIRFYLEEQDRIPELKRDAVCALCQCIEESRLRAVALLVWAGVDPLGPAPEYNDWEGPEEEWSGFPALRVFYAEKTKELLKLLKLKPSIEQWFKLLEGAAMGCADSFEDVFRLVENPERTLASHEERSAALLRRILQSLCWGWSWHPFRDERAAGVCVRLIEMGVQVYWNDGDGIASFRRWIYRSPRQADVFQVLATAAKRAKARSKRDLTELVRTEKIRGLAAKYGPSIFVHLGLEEPEASRNVSTDRWKIWRRAREPRANRIQGGPRNLVQSRSPEKVPSAPIIKAEKPPLSHTRKHPGGRVFTREEIYRDVWSEAATHVAKRYGISGSMLARICTQLDVPRPPRGYWARPLQSREGLKRGLPKWKGEGGGTWAVNPRIVEAQREVAGRLDKT